MSDGKSGFDFACPMLLKFKAMRTQERYSRIKRGVPQGSALGPLLFTVNVVSRELSQARSGLSFLNSTDSAKTE